MAEVALILWALALTVFDLGQRRLPNLLTLGGLVVGIVVLAVAGASLLGEAPGGVAQAFALAVVVTLPAYATSLLGAGDVKLAAAIAVLSGLNDFIVVYALATLLCLFALVARRCLVYLPYSVPGIYRQSHTVSLGGRRPRQIRFGAAMGGALIVVMVFRLAGYSW